MDYDSFEYDFESFISEVIIRLEDMKDELTDYPDEWIDTVIAGVNRIQQPID